MPGLGDYIKKALSSNQLTMEDGFIKLLGFRMAMLPTYTYTKLIEMLYEDYGEEVFDILFKVGKKHGEYAVDEIGKKHDIPRKKFLQQALDSANILGLGTIELEDLRFNQGKVIYRIENSPFPEEFKKSDSLSKVNHPVDHLQRGMFHTVSRAVLDAEEVESMETDCEFMGDEKCRFVVKTKD